jgi:hypothetical protein
MRELATPSFSLDIHEAHGRWAIEFGYEAGESVDYLHPTNQSKLRRFLMKRRVVPRDALLSQKQANRIAAKHPGQFRVEVTDSSVTEEEGVTWTYLFRSQLENSSTGMAATDALGWRYQLDRWARETEQELASAPSINTAISHACGFWRRALGVSGYVAVELVELSSMRWRVVWPSGQAETFDPPRRLRDWFSLLEEKT